MRNRSPFRSLLASTAVVAVLSGSVLVACGNDDDSSAAADATAVASDVTSASAPDTTAAEGGEEEYDVGPDSEVAKGLPELVALASSAAGKVEAGAKEDAGVTLDDAYAKWLAVEGTVKARDEDTYLDLEDALTLITVGQEDGDGAKAREGADTVKTLVDAYLAKFPGDGSEPPLEKKEVLEAEHKVDVRLGDYEITMPTPVPAGVVEFELENTGKEIHEFVVVKTDLAPDALPTDAQGSFDERGDGVTVVDEKEGIAAGKDAELTVKLEPGRYVFLCNLPGHFAKKMYLAAEVQ